MATRCIVEVLRHGESAVMTRQATVQSAAPRSSATMMTPRCSRGGSVMRVTRTHDAARSCRSGAEQHDCSSFTTHTPSPKTYMHARTPPNFDTRVCHLHPAGPLRVMCRRVHRCGGRYLVSGPWQMCTQMHTGMHESADTPHAICTQQIRYASCAVRRVQR